MINLGTVINDTDSSEKIRIRVEKTKATFTKMKKMFRRRDLSIKPKKSQTEKDRY